MLKSARGVSSSSTGTPFPHCVTDAYSSRASKLISVTTTAIAGPQPDSHPFLPSGKTEDSAVADHSNPKVRNLSTASPHRIVAAEKVRELLTKVWILVGDIG